MPEYLSPGVYVEEFELGPRPIEGVSTSTAGFLGITLRGPEQPRLVTGFEEFKRIYGGYLPVDQSHLAYAIDGFFNNGGQRCFIARIVGENAVATLGQFDPVVIAAVGPGVWGNRIAIKIGPGSLQDPAQNRTYFKLTVMYWDAPPPDPLIDPDDLANLTNPNRREPTYREDYDNLTANPTSVDYFRTRVNRNSNLISIQPLDPANPTVPADMALTFIGNNGVDGDEPTVTNYRGRILAQNPEDGTTEKSGLQGFEQIDEISIVCAPEHHEVANLTTALITHCTQQRDRFAVLHSNPGTDTLNNINNIRVPQDTTYAAFYFPWIKIFNPTVNQDSIIPPSGHIAGIYAKTDIERGVFKAPANVVVNGATGLQFQITKGEQDILNPRGVNCLRIFPARGIRVWGARTSSANTLWKYVPVRRYFLYVAESIDEGTQWVVFEPNNEKLWARVKQTITQFLTTEWRSGALMGTKVEEAFFVKVDRTTMTQDDIDNGRLICIIGIAPVKPAEFVIFRITQFSGNSDITEL
jgi:phage tail sheath protein FI